MVELLRTIMSGPVNGHEIAKIAKSIERLSDSVLAMDHGSLYPALPAGKKQLIIQRLKWEQMAAAITRVMQPS